MENKYKSLGVQGPQKQLLQLLLLRLHAFEVLLILMSSVGAGKSLHLLFLEERLFKRLNR